MKRALIDFIVFASDKRWAGIREFLTVAGIVLGLLLSGATWLLMQVYPQATQSIVAMVTGVAAAPAPDTGKTPDPAEAVSAERRKANRCREQLHQALDAGNTGGAGQAARCAEAAYQAALDAGDPLGAYGLFDLYQDGRLTGLFAHVGDRGRLDERARQNWCVFVVSDRAAAMNMTDMFDDIVCN